MRPKSKPLGEIGSGGGRSDTFSETASPLSTCAFAADSVTRTRCGVSAGGKFAERDHPERDPGLRLVAALVELDKALHRYPAHLLGEHGGTRHLGVELGIGEARSKRERRAADDQAKPGSPARKDPPGSRHDQGCGSQQARLLGKREISKDAAAEQDRDPKREAV